MTGKMIVHLGYVLLLVVTSSRASLLGRRVFPNDIEPPPRYQRHHFSDQNIETNEVDGPNFEICETKECKQMAAEFLAGMNQEMDPCEDFYEFSCGGWGSNITIPKRAMSWTHDTLYQDMVYYRLKETLEIEPNSNDILPVQQAKKWYRSCMDTDTLGKKGMGPIQAIVMQAGCWPLIMEDGEFDSVAISWQSIDRHYARLTGSQTFFDINVHPPEHVREFRAIRIGPPKFLLDRESMIDTEWYLGIIEEVIDMFIQQEEFETSGVTRREEIDELVKFESQLLQLLSVTEWGYNISDFGFTIWDETEMYLEEFAEWYEEFTDDLADDPKTRIDWVAVIEDHFNMADLRIDPDWPIYVNNMEYIRSIGELLARTSARTIVNYVHWNFVITMMPYTIEEFRDYKYKMENQHFGVTASNPRWLDCVKEMKMTHVAEYIFAKNYFTNATEIAVLDMLENIRKGLEDNIDKSNWLDANAKVSAKAKLNNLKVFFGIPDWYRNKTAIEQIYEGLTIGDDYLDNVLSYMSWEREKEFRHFRTWEDSPEETEDNMSPLILNAEYDPANIMNLPPVNFQSPLFTPGLPDNINYGLAGFTVGHEMGHGFDDSGITFGNEMQQTDLSEAMLESYYKRADCFSKQFRGYYGKPERSTTPSYNQPLEELTKGENIADTTGLQAVFHAYEKMNQKKPNGDTKLPGLERFSDEQIFYLSFAAAWCGSDRPEYLRQLDAAQDPHSPPRLRVIGAVSNTKDFARVFNCQKGTAMNPMDKCNIWQKPGASPRAASAWIKKKSHQWRWQW